MKRLTLRNYKRELQKVIKISPPGERHKFFSYAYFDKVPKKWEVHANTPIVENDLKTAICYAGDLNQNFVDFYWLKKVDWEADTVEAYSVEFRRRSCFYRDAVAIIPTEIIPSKLKLKLMDDHEVVQLDKLKRKIRARRNGNARGTGSSDSDRPLERKLQEQETSQHSVSGQEMVGKAQEAGTDLRIDSEPDQPKS